MQDYYENKLEISNISPRFRKHLEEEGLTIKDKSIVTTLTKEERLDCGNDLLESGRCMFLSKSRPPINAIILLGKEFPELEIDLSSLQIESKYASSFFVTAGMDEGIFMDLVDGTEKELVEFMVEVMEYNEPHAKILLKAS